MFAGLSVFLDVPLFPQQEYEYQQAGYSNDREPVILTIKKRPRTVDESFRKMQSLFEVISFQRA